MKLYCVIYGYVQTDASIYVAEDINHLCKMIDPEKEIKVVKVENFPDRILYTLRVDGQHRYVREAEIKPGLIFEVEEET